MTGDGNPYRFVDVSAEEQELEDPGWDLRDYVEPEDEPLFWPDEIVLIAKRWNGLAMTAIVLQGIVLALAFILQPATIAGGPARSSPPLMKPAEPRAFAVFVLATAVAQAPIAVGCFLLARSLRYPAGRSLTIGALCLIPLINLAALAVLGYQAVRTLRRHGIRSGFFGAREESLPRAAE